MNLTSKLAEERIHLFWEYLRAGMTVREAWSQAVLDAGSARSEPRASELVDLAGES